MSVAYFRPNKRQNIPGQILLCLLVIYGAFTAAFTHNAEGGPPWIVLDLVNLAIHESGHVIFAPLGMFMGILGGSLMQLIFPAVVVATFYWQKDRYSMGFGIFWFFESLCNLSHYIGDARAQQLQLLNLFTGDPIHDWNWLLTRTHMLRLDRTFEFIFHTLAIFGMAFGIFVMVTAIYGVIVKPKVAQQA